MPAFELINVQVALAGDIRSIVDRSYPENAVTWPEYEILAHIHGAGAMRGATNSGETVDRPQASERERLIGLYGADAVSTVYGGTAASLPVKAGDDLPRAPKKPKDSKDPGAAKTKSDTDPSGDDNPTGAWTEPGPTNPHDPQMPYPELDKARAAGQARGPRRKGEPEPTPDDSDDVLKREAIGGDPDPEPTPDDTDNQKKRIFADQKKRAEEKKAQDEDDEKQGRTKSKVKELPGK